MKTTKSQEEISMRCEWGLLQAACSEPVFTDAQLDYIKYRVDRYQKACKLFIGSTKKTNYQMEN